MPRGGGGGARLQGHLAPFTACSAKIFFCVPALGMCSSPQEGPHPQDLGCRVFHKCAKWPLMDPHGTTTVKQCTQPHTPGRMHAQTRG